MKISECDHVLIVVAKFSKNNLAQSERAFYLVQSLIDNGVKVTVLTSYEYCNYSWGQQVKVLTLLPELSGDFKLLNRILSPVPDGLLPLYFRSYKKILKSIDGKYDFIISTSPPHSLHYISAKISSLLNIPLAIDLRDAWKHNNMVNYGTRFHKYLSDYWYKKLLSKADVILANTSELKAKIESDKFDAQVISVPNGYPRNSFISCKSDLLIRPKHTSSSSLTLLYSGGNYGGRATRAISNLLRNTDKYVVDFLGEAIEDVKACNYLGKVSSSEVASYIMSYNALVIYMPLEEENSARILLKAYGYAKSGKPIIYIGARNATSKFLESKSLVFFVDEDDSNRMCEILDFIKSNINETKINAEDFSYEENFQKLLEKEICLKRKLC